MTTEAIAVQVRCPHCYSEVHPDFNYCQMCGRMFWPSAAVWPKVKGRPRGRAYFAALRAQAS